MILESAFILAFAAACFGLTFTFDPVPPVLSEGIRPTTFPRALLIFLGALAVLQALTAGKAAATLETSAPGRIGRKVYLTALLMVLFVPSLQYLGTFISLSGFCLVTGTLWGERRWTLALFGYACFAALIYLVFVVLMDVPLP